MTCKHCDCVVEDVRFYPASFDEMGMAISCAYAVARELCVSPGVARRCDGLINVRVSIPHHPLDEDE